MKMAVDNKKMGFLPKMSLNLAKMMRTAIMACEQLINSEVALEKHTDIT